VLGGALAVIALSFLALFVPIIVTHSPWQFGLGGFVGNKMSARS
jgi:hypothetical protein